MAAAATTAATTAVEIVDGDGAVAATGKEEPALPLLQGEAGQRAKVPCPDLTVTQLDRRPRAAAGEERPAGGVRRGEAEQADCAVAAAAAGARDAGAELAEVEDVEDGERGRVGEGGGGRAKHGGRGGGGGGGERAFRAATQEASRESKMRRVDNQFFYVDTKMLGEKKTI